MRTAIQETAASPEFVVPELLTPRLRMCGMSKLDVDALWKTVGRADVMAYSTVLSASAFGLSRDQTDTFIEKCKASWSNRGFGRWGVEHRDTQALIGYCGLNEVDYLPEIEPAIELSIRLHPDYWGQGYAPEALTQAINWGFQTLEVDSFVGCTVPENFQSVRALRKLGMRHQATLFYPGADLTEAKSAAEKERNAEFAVFRIRREKWKPHTI